MDANGLRFWMLAEERHWQCGSAADFDGGRRRLRLRSLRELPDDLNEESAEGEARMALGLVPEGRELKVPQARDGYGTRAYWDPELRVVAATGVLPRPIRILDPPGAVPPDDLVLGHDGVLYVAHEGRLRLHDLRRRWEDVTLSAPGFTAWRLAADPGGGVWALDREAQRLGHVSGLPLPARPFVPAPEEVARPCREDPEPATLDLLPEDLWPGREAVALACSPTGRLAVLTWRPGEDARLFVQRSRGRLDIEIRLRGVRFPYALTWLSESAIATRASRLPREALVYDLGDVLAEEADERTRLGAARRGLRPMGDVYPLRGAVAGPFAHTLSLPPHYPTADGTAPLLRLSAPGYPATGLARGRRPFDSGDTSTVWHRLYLEALVPAECAVCVCLAATDEPVRPTHPAEWHEHWFGAPPAEAEPGPATPRGAWTSAPSEIPFAPGLLDCPPERDRRGLFTALIQRSNRRVRSLRGRYLWVYVRLYGNGRTTPEVAALRAYGSRFSYVERYLPALYHESLFGSESEEVLEPGTRSSSTPADFLERFVANFEGVLTNLEDRIASAHLLSDPRTVPEESLEWLAAWIGVSFDPALPPERRRRMVSEAPRLFRERGTLDGLKRALDVATGGACGGGEIVVVEDWRLRRTFATILGADLADEDDPLLGGLAVSGNSFVGDTLLLGEENRKEFLALFGADLPVSDDEAAAIAEFFGRLAHRVTVLVHQEVEPQDLGLIRRVVELEKPAHVAAEVVRASHAFRVGIASLVAVDSYLRPPPEPRWVHVEESVLGAGDLLFSAASLDPRLSSSRAPVVTAEAVRPRAVVRAPPRVQAGTPIVLDGARSRAGPDRELAQFAWQWLR